MKFMVTIVNIICFKRCILYMNTFIYYLYKYYTPQIILYVKNM